MKVAGETGRDQWRARVTATPDRLFVIDGTTRLTFAEADAGMLRIAGGLASLGVGAGTRVLVGLPNSARAVLVHAALRELGAVMVPLLPGLTADELAFQIEHSEGELLIAEDPVAPVVLEILDRLPGIRTVVVPASTPAATRAVRRVELHATERHAPLEPGRPLPGHHADSPWAILYTSGSTGRPKGVVLTAGSFVHGGIGYAERFGVTAADNCLVATPMAHAVGALTEPCIALYTGCRLTIVDRFSPTRFWGQVADSGATVTVLFPAQLNLLLAREDGPARGATPLRLVITHARIEAFRDRFGVELGLCWGMTESGAGGTGTRSGYDGGRGEGYVGVAMRGVELAIKDAQRRTLGPGEEGEICLRNRHRLLEYLRDPAATAELLVDGWIHSGDRGVLDADGHLTYRGRIKNMIKRSGENISPEEIEGVLEAHEDVAESLVLGVPDPIRTEEVAAVVVLREGRADAEALAAFVAARLARWKAPRYLALRREPLPRLANGKIDRQRVRRELDVRACWDARATHDTPAR